MLLRRLHAYLSIFVAPSILFFALTGALQLFNLHEASDGYDPPALIRHLATLHKDQRFGGEGEATPGPALPAHKVTVPTVGALTTQRPKPAPWSSGATLVLKWFFLVVSTALCLSTCLGLWLGLRAGRHRRLRWCLLMAGTAVPIMLSILTATF